MGVETFDIEQSFGEFANASALAEASAFKTVKTGPYRVQVTKAEGKKFDNDPRKFANLTVAIMDETGQKKLSTAWVDVTWEEKRDQDGKLDRGFQLWNQLTRALYPDLNPADRSKKDVGTVLNDAKMYPVNSWVMEKFRVEQPDGKVKWIAPKTDEEAVQYRSLGGKVINTVSNFSKLQ